MFEFVRKHAKIFMALMFLLIIPSFVLLGVEGYTRNANQSEAVARVDGQDITQAQWDAEHSRVVEQLRAGNPGIDTRQLEQAQARYLSLERLVHGQTLLAAAAKSHLNASDARIARVLNDDPSIAALRQPDGTLDLDGYRQLLRGQGMTPAMFEARVRDDLSSRQVLQSLGASSFVPAAQADVTLKAYSERREIQAALFKSTDFKAQAQASDADIEAYYQKNLAQFHLPEQAKIEFLVLDLDMVTKSIVPLEAMLKDYYQQNLERFTDKEERRVRHILVNAPKGIAQAEHDAARAKAEQLLAQLRQAPTSFAEVARKNSQDTASAPQGGELGFFSRGMSAKMFGVAAPAFENAAFALKKNEISGLVETDFGFHLIELAEIKTHAAPSFESLRVTLEADYRQQQAQRSFAEAAEVFSNMAYEQADSLQPLAERLKLSLQTATVAPEPTPGAQGALASKQFLTALFSADAVEKKRNTETVEFGINQIAVGRVSQHTPAHTQPLADVRSQVQQAVLQQHAATLARQEGQAKLAAWAANPDAARLPAAQVVSRNQPQGQPAAIIDAALLAERSKLPAWVGADLGADGFAVLRVNQVLAPTPAADPQRERDAYAQAWNAAETAAYYALLKERLKVKILAPKPSTAAPTP